MESEIAVVQKTVAAQNSGEMSSEQSENSHKLSPAGEMKTESTTVNKTAAVENSGEMSSEQSENSCKDDLHLKAEDEIKSIEKGKKYSFQKKNLKN
ncbi:hypothetical protein AVEN_176315-1 [Araneus ventricosus]|uniref:Uncharacterized protein n=1 Tax=Araneus ventricosus TaxID=182803 RepID=A0A4Y2UWE5_ARAVE|nr:hypothetical protein AVEN_269910-1 [Araneus ventricosus]GBO26010.1 hypothetical protein AVEN_176315-1 [Araneus ventricosus]